jgi:hypothetical protein
MLQGLTKAGVDDFADVLKHSMKFESFGVGFPVVDLPELIRAKRAAGPAEGLRAVARAGSARGVAKGPALNARTQGLTYRPLRGTTFEHAAHTQVLIDVWPTDARTVAEDLVVCALLRRRVGQTPRPRKRDTDDPPVDEMGDDELVGDFDGGGPRICAEVGRLCHSTHVNFVAWREAAVHFAASGAYSMCAAG